MDFTSYRTIDRNKNVAPALVDVPVQTNIWIREECQRKQFDVIRKARPSIIFLLSDGGRNDTEWEKIRRNRLFIEHNIDWDCEVHQMYAEKNYGLYGISRETSPYVWSRVDRCIILEDDHIPAVSFFRFCKELLEKYENDLRVVAISGMNHAGIYEAPSADYLFSRVMSIWGYAIWRRTYESWNTKYKNDNYVIEEVCNLAKREKNFCKTMKGYTQNEKVNGHIPGSEFYLQLNMFANHQLYVVPKKNMISCMGATTGATHAANDKRKIPQGIAQVFDMKVYEIEGDIIHPQYVFPDTTFEKIQCRVMGWHHPMVRFYRRVVSIVKRIRYGDIKAVMATVKKKMVGYQIQEK